MVNKIDLSVQEEVNNVAEAMTRVTRAIFAGSPGAAKRLKGKRKTAQFTFKAKDRISKTNFEKAARREIMKRVFEDQAVQIEQQIKRALEAVIAGLVGQGSSNVRVFARSLGTAKPRRDLNAEGFARFIKSPQGAGEIGLPDPDESLRQLKIALLTAITVDVIVRAKGPHVKFTFDQRRLLKLTPHPLQFESGAPAPFFSWLSLVTGPNFVRGGTPGFALVTVRDMQRELQSQKSIMRGRSRGNLRAVRGLEGLMSLSRTKNNAGEFAAIMLSTQRRGGKRSSAEFAGGSNQKYRPSRTFEGFWDTWWLQTKGELGIWSRRVMFAAIRSVLKG